MIKKIIKWLGLSNRYKHLILGILAGLLANDWYCCEYAAIGVACALELKDYLYGGKPDIIDFLVTIAGFNLGYSIRLLFLLIHG